MGSVGSSIGHFYEGLGKAAVSGEKALVDPFGIYGVNKEHTVQTAGGLLNATGLKAIKPPKLAIDSAAADAAAAHTKDLLAAAFGLNDTKLTGQQGLGSVPKSLLAPKTTLGGY